MVYLLKMLGLYLVLYIGLDLSVDNKKGLLRSLGHILIGLSILGLIYLIAPKSM